MPLPLNSAGDFVILAKAGISMVPPSDVTGDMGVSPITSTAITGFALIMDGSGEFSTSAQVNGNIYAPDYAPPTPDKMTSAISDMETAYTTAAGRTTPDSNNLGATAGSDKDIGGLTFAPGLHKWTTGVLVSTDVTLDAAGDANAIFIFQIEQNLTIASGQSVILSGGAQAKNVFWQVAGGAGAIIGTTAHFEGVLLTATAINVFTGGSFNGKLLAQTDVNLQQNVVVDANLIPPPEVQLEIISAHGTGTPATGVYVNVMGSLLTNSISAQETIGGTQCVNTGWSMIGNDPLAGSSNTMEMVHTNDAVLTWLWQTNYLLNASAGSGGAVTGDTNGFYAAGSNVSITAGADPGWTFVGWTGEVTGPTNSATQTITMDQARTVVAHFFTDRLTLEIVSEHGVGTPSTGIYANASGTTLTNSISAQETIGGTQCVNTGWSMIGNDPLAGSSNTMEMVHTNDAVLTWLWQTNYLLNTSAGSGGAVTGDTNGFYAAGSNVSITAGADPGWTFVGWSGDVTGPTNAATQTMTMDQARIVTAAFAAAEQECGTPVTQGAFMELDLSSRFTGSNLAYDATSTQTNVMSASITLAGKLRLDALTPGLTIISVTATDAFQQTQLYTFPVAVVGDPLVLSNVFQPHEPWNPRFEQRFVVQNDTGNACPAIGLRLLFSNIEPGIVIENQTGLTPAPDGRPMIEWEVLLPTGSTQELSVIYVSTGAFRPDQSPPTVEVQYILPNTPPVPAQEGGLWITSIRTLADDRVVLEFASVAGRSYVIDYMNDFPTGIWRTVPLVLYAGGNRTQWIDYGPPATLEVSGARVYRIRDVSP